MCPQLLKRDSCTIPSSDELIELDFDLLPAADDDE